MNQEKIGNFLKCLRKERGLTQEQLAEQFYVSSRTVSRWETGSNLPDLNALIELADFYDIGIQELIDGERKETNMDQETKNTLKKVAEYSDAEKNKLKKHVFNTTLAVLIVLLTYVFLEITEISYLIPERLHRFIMGFTSGIAVGTLIVNLMYLCGVLEKFRAWKRKHLHLNGKG